MQGSKPKDLKIIKIIGQEEPGLSVGGLHHPTTELSTRELLFGFQVTCLLINITSLAGNLSQDGAGPALQEGGPPLTPQALI